MSTPPPEPMPLRVARVDEIATDIFGYELRRPDDGLLPPFTAGAHVTVWLPNGGTRCFSLANNPLERDRYEIAVKRESIGRGGSKSLIDSVRPGDMLPVSAPDNWFALVSDVSEFLFVAGGIGITPIMAMMRHLNASRAARYKLYYLTRSPSVTPFINELQMPPFAGNVIVHHDEG